MKRFERFAVQHPFPLIALIAILCGLLVGCNTAPPPTPAEARNPAPTPTPAPTATVPPTATPEPESPFAFRSECTHANYRIYVSLPPSYDPAGSERYPVIYLLDGDWYFDGSHWRMEGDGVAGIVAGLGAGGAIPESILVGIGYEEGNGRDTDFLWYPDRFYRFLTEELMPLMEEEYRADLSAGGTLMGHSDGGYFTMYALFQHTGEDDAPFNRFVAVSGDYTKNNSDLFTEELRLYRRLEEIGQLDVALYMTVGGREEARFVTSNQQIAERLESRGYDRFRFQSEPYPALTHANIIRPAVVNGLHWVFGE